MKQITDLVFPGINYAFPMVFVEGTKGIPYLFGVEEKKEEINISDFYISRFLVTQKLWDYIMGNEPADHADGEKPVVNASFDNILGRNGFLERFNAKVRAAGYSTDSNAAFRLPTETEWEYAARGAIHWKDNFTYSGSNNIDEVAWYLDNSNREIKPVGQKKPNQLGIYDMCGNVWEWCHDHLICDTNDIPKDGTPCLVESKTRVLRGGCNHNWTIHCTVSKRYEIPPDSVDGAIGFRIALSRNRKTNVAFKNAWPYKDDKMNLPVRDVEAAIPFYETILGFRLISRNDSPHKLAVLERDGIQIGLAENGGDPEQEGCFFEVDDVEKAIVELNANGFKKEFSEIGIEKHGETSWRVFYMIAPDGLCYCIGERRLKG